MTFPSCDIGLPDRWERLFRNNKVFFFPSLRLGELGHLRTAAVALWCGTYTPGGGGLDSITFKPRRGSSVMRTQPARQPQRVASICAAWQQAAKRLLVSRDNTDSHLLCIAVFRLRRSFLPSLIGFRFKLCRACPVPTPGKCCHRLPNVSEAFHLLLLAAPSLTPHSFECRPCCHDGVPRCKAGPASVTLSPFGCGTKSARGRGVRSGPALQSCGAIAEPPRRRV